MGAIHDKCVDVPSRGVHKAVMIVLDKMEGFRRKAMGLEDLYGVYGAGTGIMSTSENLISKTEVFT